ncbi:7464_t:CDS:2 [Funneliformis geosporum]|uniref:16920_t:CDS:1 n=1 Tax=Funneliformis geosporum TaxID=1117311 RepID=A0A9W4WQ67_9GLOM|nr:16920_t:CDS:2 [Funneliformis geosporum]CAI2167777.1 7464_t:CDS:2 [Funneliformis geosporum]
MSLTLKPKGELNLFGSVVNHVSLCANFTLSVACKATFAINLLLYVVGSTLAKFTKQFVMIASERSASTAKWCLVLIDEIFSLTIDYVDFDDKQDQKVSSEATSIKTILANASKRKSRSRSASLSAKKGIAGTIAAPISPIARSDAVKKTDASQPIEILPKSKSTINKTHEAALSMFAEISLRKSEKCMLTKEQQSRPLIASSLGQNRSKDWKSMNVCPSKRYSTLANENPKRNYDSE